MPTVFITSGTSWNIPNDFGTLVSIECIGAGAPPNIVSQGGGGGAYASITTLALTPGQSITIQVGTGTSGNRSSNHTWFNGASLAGSSVGAEGAASGGSGGGTAANSKGSIRYSGGNGGAASTGISAGGGGGAAGPQGNGGVGGDGASGACGGGGGSGGGTAGGNAVTNLGGAGGNNYLGSGGGAGGSVVGGTPSVAGSNGGGGGGGAGSSAQSAGSAGGAGTEYDATHGSGGGGGGGYTASGVGGGYGGGGGARDDGNTSSVGGPGLIIFTYLPAFIPSTRGVLATALLAVAAGTQWSYAFLGGAQPYAPKQNNPALIESITDNPPFRHPGRTPQHHAIATQQWQPPIWPYAFLGNAQPYMGVRLNPDNAAIQVNDPPFDRRRAQQRSEVVALWQPDPWAYAFMGRWQPFEKGKLNPADILVPEANPPFRHPGRLITTEIAQRGYQPEAWPYVFMGRSQPYEGKKVAVDISAVPENDPPFGIPNKSILANILSDWQPPIWPYTFMGRSQPYEGRKVAVDISAVPENDPPFTHRGRTVNTGVVTATWQPDPWVYAFMGGKGPFVPAKLSAGVPGQAVDNPPFRHPARTAQPEIAQRGYQPDIWPYIFMGGHQPYQRGNLPPDIINIPIQLNYRLVLRSQTTALDWTIKGLGNTSNYPNGRRYN